MQQGRIQLGTWIGIGAMALLVIGGASIFWNEVQQQLPTANEFSELVSVQYGQSKTTDHQATEKPTVDDDPALGPADAPLTIIAFEDFECPYSAAERSVEKQLLTEFPDQIRFVYRDFPLTTVHANALNAAEAANCANAQGKFWEMHDQLFIYQKTLSSDMILEAAKSLGLDMPAFTKCVEDQTYKAEILADLSDGVKAGVSGTPTYFLNGIKLQGTIPIDVFRKAINYFVQ